MRVHLVVRGRVQGVGFRWFVREQAHRLDLAGWVRNRPDGGVEVAAEGDDASIEALRRVLAQGPRGAAVDRVESLDDAAAPLDRPFTILK
jgi:acylphosphatase